MKSTVRLLALIARRRLTLRTAAGPSRSAVEEVARDVLHDAHRLGADHRLCSAASAKRSG
eukprot:6041672-Prymnesium_polylepis.1